MDRYRMLPSYRYYDVEGTSPLTLDRSVGKSLRDYKIYGNSVQDGTPTPDNPVEVESVGDNTKNILPLNDFEGSIAWGNVADAIISVTPNTQYYFSIQEFERLSNIDKGNITMYIYSNEALNSVVKTMTFNLPGNTGLSMNPYRMGFNSGENSVLYCKLRNSTGTSTQIKIKGMMICSDKDAEYEPYGYKIPIEVGGKNLFNINSPFTLLSGIANLVKTENSFSFETEKTQTSSGVRVSIWLEKGTYRMSGSYTNQSGRACGFDVRKDGVSIHNFAGKGVNEKFDIAESGEYQITFYKSYLDPVGNITTFSNIQLEYGETASSYEPYKEPIKTNIYLNEPLYRMDKYADYIDFKNGKVVRENKKIALQMNNDMAIYRDRGSVVTYRTNSISIYLNNYNKRDPYNIPNMCNKFKFMNGSGLSYATDEHGEWLACAYGAVYVTIRKDRLSEVTNSSVTEYVNNLNAELIYALDVPTEQPIDLPPILTHKGTNVISVGTEIQPSNMQIQYYK